MIADARAFPFLVGLLWRQGSSSNHRIANGVVRRAANAITNLAHENAQIKTREVRNVFRFPCQTHEPVYI